MNAGDRRLPDNHRVLLLETLADLREQSSVCATVRLARPYDRRFSRHATNSLGRPMDQVPLAEPFVTSRANSCECLLSG